jgi:hypothetical protein
MPAEAPALERWVVGRGGIPWTATLETRDSHHVAVDPEGQELQYYWVADAPEMLNERQKDSTYYAAWGVGGGTLRIRITVYVCDRGAAVPGADGVAQGETHIDVRSLDDGGG